MSKLLIHVCCAHCLGKLLTGLAEEPDEWDILLFWGNPNIHPLIEWRRRLKAVRMLAERLRRPLRVDDGYGLVPFCRAVHGHEQAPARCVHCYAMRMNRAAEVAREETCAAFTSTLVTSRHQDHALIRAAGEAAARTHGIPYIYRDWREAQPDPKLVQMLYHQSYCGCIYSEYDRYKDTRLHVWSP